MHIHFERLTKFDSFVLPDKTSISGFGTWIVVGYSMHVYTYKFHIVIFKGLW